MSAWDNYPWAELFEAVAEKDAERALALVTDARRYAKALEVVEAARGVSAGYRKLRPSDWDSMHYTAMKQLVDALAVFDEATK
jgi:hypothetical protein